MPGPEVKSAVSFEGKQQKFAASAVFFLTLTLIVSSMSASMFNYVYTVQIQTCSWKISQYQMGMGPDLPPHGCIF